MPCVTNQVTDVRAVDPLAHERLKLRRLVLCQESQWDAGS